MQQGQGLVAAFDGPTRAINFACDVLETIRSSGKLEADTKQKLIAALDEFAKIFQPSTRGAAA